MVVTWLSAHSQPKGCFPCPMSVLSQAPSIGFPPQAKDRFSDERAVCHLNGIQMLSRPPAIVPCCNSGGHRGGGWAAPTVSVTTRRSDRIRGKCGNREKSSSSHEIRWRACCAMKLWCTAQLPPRVEQYLPTRPSWWVD